VKRAAIGASTLLLLVVGAVAVLRQPQTAIPVYRVKPTAFVRRVTAEGNLKSVKATPLVAPHDAPGTMKIAWIADDGAFVRNDDIVVRFDPTDFEKELTLGNEDHSMASNDLFKTELDASTTRVNLRRDATQADRELESARRFKFDDAEVFSRYQRIETEVDARLASDRKTHAENVLTVRDGLARTNRDLLGIEEKKAALRIRNARQGLSSLEIRAPYDGILVLQRDWRGDVARVGSNVWPGMSLGEIPDLASMKAEVFVLEADAAGLAVGKSARVVLESQPGTSYAGKITQVDKLARPRLRGVPVQYFGVTITLDRTDSHVMKPGTRVRATLEIENRARAFAIPRQALFEKQGKRIVYRKQDGRFMPLEVDVATSSAGRVVVTHGLKEGDELALVDPTEQRKDG
jgi:HlyD family secretion protein